MYPTSSLTQQQREQTVALFEAGYGAKYAATRLGVSQDAVRRLHQRWKLRGSGALVPEPSKRSFSFEFKLDVVRRLLAGEATPSELAREHGLSSPKLVENWARAYRREGQDALRPKPRGRPADGATSPAGQGETEVERLREQNRRLAAENAYLKKLRALREQGRQ